MRLAQRIILSEVERPLRILGIRDAAPLLCKQKMVQCIKDVLHLEN